MTGRILLQSLTIPVWLTDRNGTVCEIGTRPCPFDVGQSCFPHLPPILTCGIASCPRKRRPDIRFFYRATRIGILCIAYPCLSKNIDPFGREQERLTRWLDEITALLLHLCLHPDTAEEEWLDAWKQTALLAGIKQDLDRGPELIAVSMFHSLLAHTAEAFDRSRGRFLSQWELPIDKTISARTCFDTYRLLCAVLLLLNRLDASHIQLRALSVESRPELHLRARIAPERKNEAEFAIERLRTEASFGTNPMRLQTFVTSDTLLVRLHDARPLRDGRLRWKWLEPDEGSPGKWYRMLLTLADGIASVSLYPPKQAPKKADPVAMEIP